MLRSRLYPPQPEGVGGAELGLANEMAINQFIAHHSVIFQPEKKLMWVSTSPWQCGKYVAYDLNRIFSDSIDFNHEIYTGDLTLPADSSCNNRNTNN